MSSDTYSNPILLIGGKEITTFKSVQYSETGKSSPSSLNINISDPDMRDASLSGKEVVFFLNYGSTDTVPFFRGIVRQVNPSENDLKIIAYDVRTLLTGNESLSFDLTDKDNYDGYTLSQFIQEFIIENVNIDKTIIGLDLVNETDPVVSLSGVRGSRFSALKLIKQKLPKNDNDINNIVDNRLAVVDDGIKSNITFVKEQQLTDSGVTFTYSDGINKITHKKRPAPNLISAISEDNSTNVIYKHNNLKSGVRAQQLKEKFSYPDEAIQASYVLATYAEIDTELKLDTTKGHYLGLGNVVNVHVTNRPEQSGKFRILSKQVTCSNSGVTCQLQVGKERPEVNEFF